MTFAPGRVSSLELIYRMRAEAFDLTSWSTIQALAPLQNLIDLHLIRDLHVLEIGQFKSAVFFKLGLISGGAFSRSLISSLIELSPSWYMIS